MSISSFRDLTVWQKSYALTKDIYELCMMLPKSEQFGLISQMQRSAVSIPSNIAEGQQRNNRAEYRQFIGIAKGSAVELETQLLLTSDIHKIDTSKATGQLTEIQKMLYSLAAKL